ncbi:hypothetical protein LOTGIDRAFT_155305 [Lottia gigantea]|uniref:SUEL-type lectin domain-containing protein n=1 Tax=Lottia gigantea TaxID=225164 RepID=V4B671_LOTGI|nr:hypothetical protein LOTGIDRAFT_155305 [Lottia gigantea]ESO83994.1 hypothetical protein LOTGIDRAFT_155305 [Lottia gigantea]
MAVKEVYYYSCTSLSTVCYGVQSLQCTTHRLSCPSPLVIQIINTSYGYRPECNDVRGISDCNTTCCDEEPDDCFVPFETREEQQVLERCNGNVNCSLPGYRRYNTVNTVCYSSNVSAYSKIQYDCVTNGPSIITQTTEKSTSEVTQTPEESTTSSTTQYLQSPVEQGDSIVGGVLGTLLIISVIINVGLVVYFARKMKSLSSTPRENNYDGITNTGRDQTLPTYDDLQVNSTASSDHVNKTKSNTSYTYYNTKGESLSRNIDPYYENMKRP